MGTIEPLGHKLSFWRFWVVCLHRVRMTLALQQDFGVNTPDIALVLDLLEALNELRARLRRIAN